MSTLAERPVVTPDPSAVTPAPPVPAAPGTLAAARRVAEREIVAGRRQRVRAVVGAYVSLTKPRIVELLLVTTVPAMVLAEGGLPSVWLLLVVVVGGALAAGAANALNCYIDRDIDQVMKRTSRRPLATHVVAPRSALIFGLTLAVLSTVLMVAFTNLLAAGLTVAAIAYYDLVYTLWLKRTTPANTFWGGVCGAAPVLIGWAAVTGGLSWRAWILFAVVFLWQMPHFYALAVKFKDDYARAGIPMLPVVRGMRRVGFEVVAYSWLTVLASLALWPFGMTPLYGAVAVVVGVLLLVEAHALDRRARRGEPVRPMRLFHWSVTYLTILFLAVAVDALIQ